MKSNKDKKIFVTFGFFLALFILPLFSFAQVTLRNPLIPEHIVNNLYDHNNVLGKKKVYDCRVSDVTPNGLDDNHGGTDFKALINGSTDPNKPVYTIRAGRVYQTSDVVCPDNGYPGSTCGGGFGNHYRIDHDGDTSDKAGFVSIYAHLKQPILPDPIYVGGSVACGQKVGLTASSGSSSGPHLHLELRKNKVANGVVSSFTRVDPFAGSCNTTTPPSWTSVSVDKQPSVDCDLHPLSPSNVSVAQPKTNSVQLRFKDNALDEIATKIERKIGGGSFTYYGYFNGTSTTTNPGYVNTWTNTGLSTAVEHCYRLYTSNTQYNSRYYSNTGCGMTQSTNIALLAPSNLYITNVTTNSLMLNFNDNEFNETATMLEKKIGTGNWTYFGYFNNLAGANSWNFTDTGLASKKTYCYRLKALNPSASSTYSNEACGTTL